MFHCVMRPLFRTTPTSSSIFKALTSISLQLSQIYNIPIESCTTMEQVCDQLVLIIFPQIPKNEYLLILLDSIDQLLADAYHCKWLPVRFPPNIKCIVSTLPSHGNIHDNLKVILNEKECPHLFINVPPFDANTVESVYDDWLKMKKRSLSDDQRLFIKKFMLEKKEILPLFMKLVFDIISIWHSYDPIDERILQLNKVDDCIRYLFQQLEVTHNSTLFKHAMCYMTTFRNGISQNELEDILSLDDDVLRSVFQHYIPPVRRIPGILWTRIKNDLEEYITEKEVDDVPVIHWYHRRFIEVANAFYISKLNSDERSTIFQNVVDFFNETWKGKNKPFKTDNQKLIAKYQLNNGEWETQGNSLATSQPLEFIDAEGRKQYNKRKLNEFPLFLGQLSGALAIPLAASEIFFNYAFMRTCSINKTVEFFLNLCVSL